MLTYKFKLQKWNPCMCYWIKGLIERFCFHDSKFVDNLLSNINTLNLNIKISNYEYFHYQQSHYLSVLSLPWIVDTYKIALCFWPLAVIKVRVRRSRSPYVYFNDKIKCTQVIKVCCKYQHKSAFYNTCTWVSECLTSASNTKCPLLNV